MITVMLDASSFVRFYERELTNVSKLAARPPVHSASTFNRVRKRLGISYVKHFSVYSFASQKAGFCSLLKVVGLLEGLKKVRE